MSRHYLLYFYTVLLISLNQAVFSCSMTMTSASALVIQEILKTIQLENKPSDREIVRIKKSQNKHFPYWTYIIETSINGTNCQAIGYTVNIDPSCKTEVKQLNEHFICQKN